MIVASLFPLPGISIWLLSHFLLASLIYLKHVEAAGGATTSRFDMFIYLVATLGSRVRERSRWIFLLAR